MLWQDIEFIGAFLSTEWINSGRGTKMKKSQMIELITKEVEKIDCYIVKIYGVSWGVGYDLDIDITFKGGRKFPMQSHALSQSWALIGHLRPNNPYYKYTGSNDVYRNKVTHYWQIGNGFAEYLGRLKKTELEVWLKVMTIHFFANPT
jgi:hypothetical protein